MVSGVYRLPTMENVIFRKQFAEALAQRGRPRRGMTVSMPRCDYQHRRDRLLCRAADHGELRKLKRWGSNSPRQRAGHVPSLLDESQAIVHGVCHRANNRVERISRQFAPCLTPLDRIRGSSERHDLEPVAVDRQECAQASKTVLDYSIGSEVGVPKICLFHELKWMSDDHDDRVLDIMCRVEEPDLLTGCQRGDLHGA